MYCVNCGTYIKEGHSYCTNCGRKRFDIKPAEKEIVIEKIIEKPYEKKASDKVIYLIVSITIILSIFIILISNTI